MIVALVAQVKNTSSVMGKSKQVIHAVAGILRDSSGRVLVSLRPNHVPQGGFWEFPGGKLEQGETPFQALSRELWEEVGVTVELASMISKAKHAYEDRVVILETWQVSQFTGTPSGKEGQKVEWIPVTELSNREFLPANKATIASLVS